MIWYGFNPLKWHRQILGVGRFETADMYNRIKKNLNEFLCLTLVNL